MSLKKMLQEMFKKRRGALRMENWSQQNVELFRIQGESKVAGGMEL